MFVFPIASPGVTLETAGGKGANLARLARAGFNVPPGFIIATDSYNSYVEENWLQIVIDASLTDLSAEDALNRVREHHPWARPDSHHWLKLRWLAQW